ncbi:hypothetical protein JSR06_00180 [Candidatus Vidania fulgoroideae]|uniref:Pseudouridine synthase RsuA/RluA-like domain-containing protein n=1 Tax=Candidatus Vidania fulgoroideorum TaxID=881286 RepID=A0A974XE83_9PROT|nr:hypothetical protein JSR06_00180 [Candidatus Vidania fulgoroideae]
MNVGYINKRIFFILSSNGLFDTIFKDSNIICFYKKKYYLTYPISSMYKRKDFISLITTKCKYINHKLPRFGLINRLDYLSIGILIFCINPCYYNSLIYYYKNKLIKKYYITIVNGLFPQFLNSYCGFHISKKKVLRKGNSILTNFTRFSYFKSGNRYYSILVCITSTGKYHQLRDQLRIEGYNIISDSKNCKKKYFFLQFFMVNINNVLIKVPLDFLFLKLISRLSFNKKTYI